MIQIREAAVMMARGQLSKNDAVRAVVEGSHLDVDFLSGFHPNHGPMGMGQHFSGMGMAPEPEHQRMLNSLMASGFTPQAAQAVAGGTAAAALAGAAAARRKRQLALLMAQK